MQRIRNTHIFVIGAAHISKDESVFTTIMTQRSYLHLRKVFQYYKTISGKTFEEAIKEQFSGDTKEALKALGKFACK